ncbi:MAG TPA: winged helix-turn-helix domain-containing protein [Steroidobacteraceae bacterium]|nr:winged helix-turn-helix domain-containing protein [Steroidobacteraceae bacterium]
MEQGARVTGPSDSAGGPLAQAAEYCVGDLIVNIQRERVTREGHDVPLAKLSFDLLATLIRNAPDLVSVESLMQQVWPGLVVGPETVSQRIKLIRDALDDDPKQPRYIAGVRGRGYRLVAPVEPRRAESIRASATLEQEAGATSITGTPADARGGQRSKVRALRAVGFVAGTALVLTFGYLLLQRTFPTVSEKSRTQDHASVVVGVPTIAVLPFADMSPHRDQEYFADGLSEEISDQLSRLPGLHVIGRTSAFSFKGKNGDLRTIGKALGVRHILEGSVRKAGEQLRITAQLVDSNGTRVWSNAYDRKLGDVFAIQDEVARSVAVALSVTLNAGDIHLDRGGTRNVEAYDAYLAAQPMIISEAPAEVRRGLGQLEHAVSLDPDFALAWSELALIYQGAGQVPERGGAEWNAKALRASSRALKLAPDLPWVQTAAAVMSMHQRDWADAERRLQKARDLATGSENLWYQSGWFCVNVGRPAEAAEYFRRAKIAEPLLAVFPADLATTYEMVGDLDQASDELTRGTTLVDARPLVEFNKVMLAMVRGDREQIEKVISGPDWPANDMIGRAMASRLGDSRAALAQLRRAAGDPAYPKSIPSQSELAYWAAYFGDPQLSLQLMRSVLSDPSFAFVLWRPIVRDMRRLPAFKDLVRDLGLADYWRASGNWGQFCRPLDKNDFECT